MRIEKICQSKDHTLRFKGCRCIECLKNPAEFVLNIGEEVERRNAIFDYEANRLKNCQLERVNELKESLMQTLSEVNALPIQVVRKIWSYAWSKESYNGDAEYYMVYLKFKELANLYKDLLNTED